MPIDRRVARTRTALYDALVALILQQDYDTISVQDILDEANVGRSTFYTHFTSKDDLLEHSLERLRALLVEGRERQRRQLRDTGAISWDCTRTLFAHIGEHRAIHRALAGRRAQSIVLGAIRDVLMDFLRGNLVAQQPEAPPRELTVQFFVGAFMSVVDWWLDRRPDMPVEEVDRLFRQLVTQGVAIPSHAAVLAAD